MATLGTTPNNPTLPTTIGALLTEENTIDPLSPLPSFLELTFVDVARNSGRKALAASWGFLLTWLQGILGGLDRRIERGVVRSRALSRWQATSRVDDGFVSAAAHLHRSLQKAIIRLQIRLYRNLRQFLRLIHKTIDSLAPELQSLIMFAIDYHCVHHLAGSTACEMVYGLRRSKIVKSSLPMSVNENLLNNNSNSNRQISGAAAATANSDTASIAKQQHYQYRLTELSSWNKTCSAFLAAFFPYWKEKCEKLYETWQENGTNHDTDNSTSNASFMIDNYNRRFRARRRQDDNINIDRNNSTGNDNRNHSHIFDIIHRQKLKQTFLDLYPYLHMTHEGSIFLYQFAYLLGYTPYWNFSLQLLGVVLRRMTMADVQQEQLQKQEQQQRQLALQVQKHSKLAPSNRNNAIQTTTTSLQTPNAVRSVPNPASIPTMTSPSKTNTFSTFTGPNLLRGAILFSVSYTVLSGWYSHFQRQLRLRRRRWIAGEERRATSTTTSHLDEFSMHGRGGQRATTTAAEGTDGPDDDRSRVHLPIPPPPLPPSTSSNNIRNISSGSNNNRNNRTRDNKTIELDKWSCPICHEPRINPTASTSGYVFCYKCLITHLRNEGEYCPVTGMPCEESRVVRLFEPTASASSSASSGSRSGAAFRGRGRGAAW
mmetsp:Transcript_24592/g.52238  ORF Transcript_24592/g.52238 Transcript_24592/m.52238 type:complete len:655 (+) Transcript_24592:180-2144(+)|eukprot:CAMPEP_0171387980 /NCGR_PEP_ID=MMETSP0879-20121228/40274_1 /TAXON_ID=67004 /ORGANISM="Thalassiosira weissflogii, Strain CCMP1336" /LENGTH=654 /DNA_ID=CAMNT_0011900315 /DNA_START=69 /DNA_END=2033 /DNA_ORIENTATION=-